MALDLKLAVLRSKMNCKCCGDNNTGATNNIPPYVPPPPSPILTVAHTIPQLANGQTYIQNLTVPGMAAGDIYGINTSGYDHNGVIVTTTLKGSRVQLTAENLSDNVIASGTININIQKNQNQ